MLSINFKDNATNEDVKAFASAVNFQKLTMTISMNEDAISRLDKKITNKDNKYTSAQVDGFKDEKSKLESENEKLQESVDALFPIYDSVKSAMVDAGSIDENVDNILRCIASAENSKLEKYALPRLGTAEIYSYLNTCHDITRSNDNGSMIMGKAEKTAYASAEDAIQRALRESLSLEESPYTEKLTIRFNKTDMRLIHETFISGFSNTYEVDKDDNGVEVSRSYKGVKVSRTIATKAGKDGVKYNFAKFNTIIARLVIGKLAK